MSDVAASPSLDPRVPRMPVILSNLSDFTHNLSDVIHNLSDVSIRQCPCDYKFHAGEGIVFWLPSCAFVRTH